MMTPRYQNYIFFLNWFLANKDGRSSQFLTVWKWIFKHILLEWWFFDLKTILFLKLQFKSKWIAEVQAWFIFNKMKLWKYTCGMKFFLYQNCIFFFNKCQFDYKKVGLWHPKKCKLSSLKQINECERNKKLCFNVITR